jgi:hypothetical protein
LESKLKNFNEFKKPKNVPFQESAQIKHFMSNVYKAKCTTKLFEALKNEEYEGMVELVRFLKSEDRPNEYFDWLTNLVIKILIVSFFTEAEQMAESSKYKNVVEKLTLAEVFCINFINREEEKVLINYCICWIV